MRSKICINKKLTLFISFILFLIVLSFFTSTFLLRYNKIYQSKAAPNLIYGGSEAAEGRWPFMGRIFTKDDPYSNGYCDATLIAPQWILTAAHCVEEYEAQELRIFMGNINLSEKGDKEEVSEIILHPKVDTKNQKNDLALLKLTEKVDLKFKPIKLNSNGLLEREGQKAVIVGWGLKEWIEKPRTLRQAVLPILSNSRVKSYGGKYDDGILYDSSLATGYPNGGASNCFEDSGGPLLVWNGVRWVQMMVSTWGEKKGLPGPLCGGRHKPSIGVRLSYVSKTVDNDSVDYLSWIREVVASDLPQTDSEYFIGVPLSSEESSDYNSRLCDVDEWDGTPPIYYCQKYHR